MFASGSWASRPIVARKHSVGGAPALSASRGVRGSAGFARRLSLPGARGTRTAPLRGDCPLTGAIRYFTCFFGMQISRRRMLDIASAVGMICRRA